METVSGFILGGSKITADGDCSHEIKRRLLLGRTTMTSLDRMLKSRDFSLLTKVHLVKAMVFAVIMYRCESWTIKKSEHWRIVALELCCWRRLLRVLGLQGDQTSESWWKSILNINCKDWCWSWSSNPLATWGRELTQSKRPWCWERLRAGGEEGDRGWDGSIPSSVQWTWVWANSQREWRTGKPGMLQPVGSQRVGHDSRLNNNKRKHTREITLQRIWNLWTNVSLWDFFF